MKKMVLLVLIAILTVCAGCKVIQTPVTSETAVNDGSTTSLATQQPVTLPDDSPVETAVSNTSVTEVTEPGAFELVSGEPINIRINDTVIRIEVTDSSGSLSLSAVGGGTETHILIAESPAGYLENAYYVLSFDRYSFVVVNYDYGSDDYVTKVFLFSGAEPREIFSLPLPISWIDEFAFEAKGSIRAVGSWNVITTAYFVQDKIEWKGYALDTESENYKELTIAKDLRVTLSDTNTASILLPGAPLSFTSTDGQSYMEFVLWDDTKGYFNFEWSSDGQALINGVSAYDYFEELPDFD